ncbi:MAG: signal peptidase I [Elusimicrobiota bacterium]|jgi:signal peptidase I|nr:signal peptidase I [Elusimicrobiota bacterium]
MEFKLFVAGVIVFIVTMMLLVASKHFVSLSESTIFKTVYSWLDTAWNALIIASIVMFFVIQAFKIPSGSMRNTLLEGDHLFVNKFIYGIHVPFTDGKRLSKFKEIKRGDIVVFKCPPEALSEQEKVEKAQKDFIKRCVAIGGDLVEIKDKKLFVNGNEVDEKYITLGDKTVLNGFNLFQSQEEYQKSWEEGKFTTIPNIFIRDNFGPVKVPQDHYMVLGDNRDFSFDSRFWGPLPDKYIRGKALFLYWPAKRFRIVK